MNCSSKIFIFSFLAIVESYIVVNLFESELLPLKFLLYLLCACFPFSLVEHPGLGMFGCDDGNNRT